MPISERLSRLAPYASRAMSDDAVQRQIDRVFVNVRDGAKRARGTGAKKAVSDRKIRRQLSAATIAATQIVRALREPAPPKRHLGRRLAVLSVIAGATVVGHRRLSATSLRSPDE